jgi:hypothetical protein
LKYGKVNTNTIQTPGILKADEQEETYYLTYKNIMTVKRLA